MSRRKPEEAEAPAQRMYVGPSLPNGQLIQFTTFIGDLPEHLEPLLDSRPAIREMIIPVTEVSRAQAAMKQPGTPEHMNFQSILRGE